MKSVDDEQKKAWTFVRRLEDEVNAARRHVAAIRNRALERDRQGEVLYEDEEIASLAVALQSASQLEQKLLGLRLGMDATEED